MTKQEFLDLDDRDITNENWVAQQLLVKMSKTQLQHTKRAFTAVNNIAYKTWARQMKFQDVLLALSLAEQLATHDTDQMEN